METQLAKQIKSRDWRESRCGNAARLTGDTLDLATGRVIICLSRGWACNRDREFVCQSNPTLSFLASINPFTYPRQTIIDSGISVVLKSSI